MSVEVRRTAGAAVAFQVAGVDGDVVVSEGRVVRVLAPALRARAIVLGVAAVCSLAWAAVVWLAYVSRHAWYLDTYQQGLLASLVALLPAAAVLSAAEYSLPLGPRRRVPRLVLPGLLAGLFAVQGALAFTGRPSVQSAQSAWRAGDLERATSIARACLQLGIDPRKAETVLDGIAMQRLEAEDDLVAAARIVGAQFHTEEAHGRARAVMVERVASTVAADQASGTWTTTLPLVALLLAADQSDPRILSLLGASDLHALDRCVADMLEHCAKEALEDAAVHGVPAAEVEAHRAQADVLAGEKVVPLWKTIRSTRKSLTERTEACASVIAPVDFAMVAGSTSFRPTRAEVDEVCGAVAKAVEDEAARKAAKAVEKARRETEAAESRRKAEEERRKREAAAAARLYAPLRCNDGSLSPSCTCAGSWRGCCSHHGGVAGCSR